MPLTVDTILENRYRINGPLATGGMGAVYRAFDTNLQVEVAIKENFFSTPQAVEQFKREALILARLRHPALPRVLQHFESEGRQYLVMELIEGSNLWELIKTRGRPFDEEQAVVWIHAVCEAVIYLHNQTPPIIHRDIKPQNIKVMPSHQVVLVDFGVAKEGSANAQTAIGAKGVTPGFSPPEQYSGGGSNPASDIYALGATLYALLTGKKPPDSVSLAIGEAEYIPPDALNPAIRHAIAEAITWAMQPRPANRPQTVEAWLEKIIHLIPPTVSRSTQNSKARIDLPRQEISRPNPESLKKISCAACGTDNPQEMKFCEDCGTPLGSVTLLCKKCGTKNRSGLRFCEECGERLA